MAKFKIESISFKTLIKVRKIQDHYINLVLIQRHYFRCLNSTIYSDFLIEYIDLDYKNITHLGLNIVEGKNNCNKTVEEPLAKWQSWEFKVNVMLNSTVLSIFNKLSMLSDQLLHAIENSKIIYGAG